MGEILARDGDRVRAGDIVVRLDETIAKANLAMVAKSLDELSVRKARLETERDGLKELQFPPALATSREPEMVGLLQSEERLFENRREARLGQKSQLQERISQLQEQISGTNLQASAKADEIKLIQEELVGVEELWKKNLVPITRVTSLKREETRLRGERGQLISTMAQARGRISETALQVIQIDQDLRSEVSKELSEAQAKIAELSERKVAANDQLKRIDIRAPQDGIVHQSIVHTVGGVINAGDPLMLVMPEGDELSIEVKVSPQDIDQLKPASTPSSGCPPSTSGPPRAEREGKPDRGRSVVDQRTGEQHYPVRIAFAEGERERLESAKFMPGMPSKASSRPDIALCSLI